MKEPQFAASKVQATLADLGFVIERKPVVENEQRADLLARRGDQSYLVEVKHQVPFRREQFLGAVAHGILELRDWGKRAPGCKPLLALWVEKAKPNAAPELEAYLRRHAADRVTGAATEPVRGRARLSHASSPPPQHHPLR
jgi:Holliday junction resolvase